MIIILNDNICYSDFCVIYRLRFISDFSILLFHITLLSVAEVRENYFYSYIYKSLYTNVYISLFYIGILVPLLFQRRGRGGLSNNI